MSRAIWCKWNSSMYLAGVYTLSQPYQRHQLALQRYSTVLATLPTIDVHKLIFRDFLNLELELVSYFLCKTMNAQTSLLKGNLFN